MSIQSAVAVEKLVVKPISPTIGAKITGIDLRQPLSADLRAQIYQALLDWKVLYFSSPDISTEQHLDFARNFSELEMHPFAPHKPDHPEVLAITHNEKSQGHENLWHSDVTWREEPSLGSILRCIECPEVGGDTLFSDMYAAYEGLPAEVRTKIDGKYARHDFRGFRRSLRARGVSEEKIEDFVKQYPNPEHPMVRTHPDTGRQALYVNLAFTREIVGMAEADSEKLLDYLYCQASTPEYQCRFHWQPDAIIFWDNRACQHYAVSDYWPQVRRVERVTIIGDKPFYRQGNPPDPETSAQFQGLVGHRRNGTSGRY